LSQLRGATEPDFGGCKNYLRILKTFQAAACHQGQEAPAVLLEEQIQLLEAAITSTVTLSDQAKGNLAESYQKLAALIQSLRENNHLGSKPQTLPTPQPDVASQPAALAADGPRKEAPRAAASIRVDQEKLDRLMRSAGELLVARNAFPILAKRLALEHGLSAMGKEVKDAGDQISHIADDLQAAVMSIRMMPIRTVFQRFPRMVRDICRAQGKEVELLLEGEDTELDKTVIEQIADPLVHLVRNAADHGIESPEVRAQTGKPRAGKVTLKAYNKENNVVIEVHDDGRGMDPVRLKQKAIEKGLITSSAAEAMNDPAALELIFLPGFTTAENVTDISGRGVGMDVVRSNIRKLHGTTRLESHLGGGSKITITLPASLMVSKGILVEANGEEYVFPMESVVQMVRLPRDQIHRHEQAHFATFRNEVYPVLRLADHFASEPQPGEIVWPAEVAMAIVQTQQERVGVAVDRFISDVEVIVKPMGRDFANIPAFEGATIMGDGRVALVINPAGLV
jgi:two-component system chemotaxis sensor kinase CheA